MAGPSDPIPFLHLAVKDPGLRAELLEAVASVLDHGRFLMGPEHDRFEAAMAEYCGRTHGIGLGSGTDALFLTIKALGIGPGDEVVTTPLTWVATTNAVVLNGATPVFADVGEDLNVDAQAVEAAITPATKALLPVHFTGHMCDMDALSAIAERHGLILIEDAAQAFGARHGERAAGAYGRAACFSMNPMKVYNAYGEAGAVVTDDADLAERLRSLRYAGTVNKEDCITPSINGRLDTLHAAMLLVKLHHLDAKIAARRQVAAWYGERLADIVACPGDAPGYRHSYYSYTIVAEDRDALKDHLAKAGIETKIMHPLLMPEHSAYKGRFEAEIPNARRLVKRILSLPAHEDITEAQVARVAEAIRAFYA